MTIGTLTLVTFGTVGRGLAGWAWSVVG